MFPSHDRIEINEDGFVEYFGRARPINLIPFDSGTLQAANNSPSNQDIYLSDNLGVGRIENSFQSGTTDRSSLVRPLPLDIDTSAPIKLVLHWLMEGSDSFPDFDITVRWAFSNANSNVYTFTGSAPTTAVGEQSITQSFDNPGINQTFQQEFMLDISDAIFRRDDGAGDLMWLSFQRS